MKYLMGLILSFTLGYGAYAQDRQESDTDVNQCVQACLEEQRGESNQGDTRIEEQNMEGQSDLKETPCENQSQGAMEKGRYENGSVYYHEDPELKDRNEESSADAGFVMDSVETTDQSMNATSSDQEQQPESKMEGEANADVKSADENKEVTSENKEEDTDVTSEITEGAKNVGEDIVQGAEKVGETIGEGAEKAGGEVKDLFTDNSKGDTSNLQTTGPDAEMAPQGGLWKMANQCALQRELTDRTGTFKIKKDLDGGAELKVEREKDGDESLKYQSDNEVYTYKKNEKGETEYYYSILKDNEMVEYIKDKDGVTDVIYHGVFNSPEEANNAVESGVEFEGFSSVCSQ